MMGCSASSPDMHIFTLRSISEDRGLTVMFGERWPVLFMSDIQFEKNLLQEFDLFKYNGTRMSGEVNFAKE